MLLLLLYLSSGWGKRKIIRGEKDPTFVATAISVKHVRIIDLHYSPFFPPPPFFYTQNMLVARRSVRLYVFSVSLFFLRIQYNHGACRELVHTGG